MADRSEDRLLDHDYDGIREYDNPMPRWWLWVFYATIIFSGAYYFLPLPFGEGPGVVAEYEADVARHAAAQPAAGPALTDDQLLGLAANAGTVAEGQQVYQQYCAACHRVDGGGLIGPNLTDDAWIHGGAPTLIHKTIVEGVLAKGMPEWGRILKPGQVDAVTAYVISLRGTNPKDAKAPEGVAAPAPTGG